MKWVELVKLVVKQTPGRPRPKRARAIIKLLFSIIAEEATHGRRVVVPGFGVFHRRSRKARRLLHPITKEPIRAPASLSIGFRCSKTLRR